MKATPHKKQGESTCRYGGERMINGDCDVMLKIFAL